MDHPPGVHPAATLGERQAALVAALVGAGPTPAGFDEARLAAARRALLRKRAASAAAAWPMLAASLGDRWTAVFARFRIGHDPVGGLREGWQVARELRELGELPAAAAAELAAREADLDFDGRRPPRARRTAGLRRLARRMRSWGGS